MYYRLHSQKTSESDFISNAKTWHWEFDDNGCLYEKQVDGYYSACSNPSDLLAYIDNGHVDGDEPVAVFEGEEADYTPESDCAGEVWVKPTNIVRWTTVKELKENA